MGNCRLSGLYKQSIIVFLSTLPMGGATLHSLFYKIHHSISIHAPRGGSDVLGCSIEDLMEKISIHAPRGGSDSGAASETGGHGLFLSTLPVGGATYQCYGDGKTEGISIHAPRGGSDSKHDNIPFIFATVYYAI